MFERLNQERRKRLKNRLSKLYEQYDLETRNEERLRIKGHIDTTEHDLRVLETNKPNYKKFYLLVLLLILLGASIFRWCYFKPKQLPNSIENLLNQGEYSQARLLCDKESPSPARDECLQVTGFYLDAKPIESFEAQINQSTSIYAPVMQAEAATARNDFATAKTLYTQSTQTHPNIAQAYYGLGQVYQFQNQPLEALAWYQKAVEHAPKNRRFLLNLASIQAELNQLDTAIATYKQVLTIDSSVMLAYIELLQVYEQKQDVNAVKVLAQHACQAFENNKATWQQQELNQIPWEIRLGKQITTLQTWDEKVQYFKALCREFARE